MLYGRMFLKKKKKQDQKKANKTKQKTIKKGEFFHKLNWA